MNRKYFDGIPQEEIICNLERVMAVKMQTYIDGSIVRTARKEYRCHGRGKTCQVIIYPKQTYVEYLGEVAAYQSGHRYCLECAKVALGVD